MGENHQSPRPTKRARFDDTADLYATPSANPTSAVAMNDYSSTSEDATTNSHTSHSPPTTSTVFSGIPGLGMLSSANVVHQTPASLEKEQDRPLTSENVLVGAEQSHQQSAETMVKPAEPSHSDMLVDQHESAPSQGPYEAASDPAHVPATAQPHDEHDATSALFALLGSADSKPNDSATPAETKPPEDPEFIEAGQANKDNPEAEWELDSSAEDSSSDASSDDSSSDDDDDDDDEGLLLDPATMAKMLMSEEKGDEEDGPSHSSNTQLRTKNEQPVVHVPKPDITVTPDMKITTLGSVEHIVDNMILIKAHISGEYQVLEQGSALCLENRDVIGAVAETIGRVQAPLYSVAFTAPNDIKDLGITQDTKVFYVDAHSTFVFTQPLKAFKGTDASNLHDEEVAEDEMEFSDDEAEAAYKRAKKEAKKGSRQAKVDNNSVAQQPAVQPYTGGAINYDDDEGEDMYTPLARPENMQRTGEPALEERSRRPFADRGRGRGAGGRGRGDRGRGDRGRGRGGRGGGNESNQRRGPAKSFPDSHNTQPTQYGQQPQPLPPKPTAPQGWSGSQNGQPTPQPSFPQFILQHQYPQMQQTSAQAPVQQNHTPQPFAWPQPPNTQQFQQLFNNFNAQQQIPYPPAPPTPGGSIPAGAFINPAFFRNQQQQQQQQQQYPQQAPAPPNLTQNGAQVPSPESLQAAQDLIRRLYQQ